MLVQELEKLSKNISGEFTALLNSSLEPQSNCFSLLWRHRLPLSERWRLVCLHLTQLELDVSGFQSDLGSVMKENTALKAKVVDLESRSKCQNICVLGLPENIGGERC